MFVLRWSCEWPSCAFIDCSSSLVESLLLLWLTHNAAFVLLWAKKENNWIAQFLKKTNTFPHFLFPHYFLSCFSKRSPWKRPCGSFASAVCHVWPEACVRDDVDQSCDHVRDFEKHSVSFDDSCIGFTTSDSKGFWCRMNSCTECCCDVTTSMTSSSVAMVTIVFS